MKRITISILLSALVATTHAAPSKSLLEERLAMGKITNITPTPIKGMYEVTTDEKLFYTNETGEFIIIGELYNLVSKENLSKKTANKLVSNAEARIKQTFIENLQLLKNNSIVETKGTGDKILFVFTNPDCPYCRKLEPELKKLTNVTIYRVLIPSTTEASKKSDAVWCSSDRQTAWDNLIAGTAIQTNECSTPIEQNIKLANKLNVNVTPVLVDAQGSRLIGLKKAEKIESFLNGATQ